MRSVIVYVYEKTEVQLEEFVKERYPAQTGPPWISFRDGEPCLYIRILRKSSLPDREPVLQETTDDIVPSFAVLADVSGKYPADAEVVAFVSTFLERFEGFAQDDYSSHKWTLQEILSGHRIDGHPFFDYAGWQSNSP